MKLQEQINRIKQIMNESSEEFQIDWGSKEIVKRNRDTTVLYLSPEKVLERAGRDMPPDFDIRRQGVRIGDRLQKATEWLTSPASEAFQPTMLYVERYYWDDNNEKREYDEPKVGISDGRHRLLAAYNLGLKEFPFEIYNVDEKQQELDAEYLESTLK